MFGYKTYFLCQLQYCLPLGLNVWWARSYKALGGEWCPEWGKDIAGLWFPEFFFQCIRQIIFIFSSPHPCHIRGTSNHGNFKTRGLQLLLRIPQPAFTIAFTVPVSRCNESVGYSWIWICIIATAISWLNSLSFALLLMCLPNHYEILAFFTG